MANVEMMKSIPGVEITLFEPTNARLNPLFTILFPDEYKDLAHKTNTYSQIWQAKHQAVAADMVDGLTEGLVWLRENAQTSVDQSKFLSLVDEYRLACRRYPNAWIATTFHIVAKACERKYDFAPLRDSAIDSLNYFKHLQGIKEEYQKAMNVYNAPVFVMDDFVMDDSTALEATDFIECKEPMITYTREVRQTGFDYTLASPEYVNYTCGGKHYQSGPYFNSSDAKRNFYDIQGYEGITNCHIVRERDETRQLMYP